MKTLHTVIAASAVWVGLIFGVTGCGSADTNGKISNATISGSVDNNVVTVFDMTTHLYSNQIYGDWYLLNVSSFVMSGYLTGTVSGSTMTLTLTPNSSGQTAFTGTVAINGSATTVTFSGGTATTNATGTVNFYQ